MVELIDLIPSANIDIKRIEVGSEDVNELLLEFVKEIITAKADYNQDRTSITYDMRDSYLMPYDWLENMEDVVKACEILCKKGYECEVYGDEYDGELLYKFINITWKKSKYYDFIPGHLLVKIYDENTNEYSRIVRDDNLLK